MTQNNRSSSSGAVTIEAKSLELALVKAAGALGVTQDEVAYEVMREDTSKGFFAFFKNPVVEIKAWVKSRAPGKETRSPRTESRPQRPAKPIKHRRRDEDDEDYDEGIAREPLAADKVEALTEELRSFCEGIASSIAGEPVKVEAKVDEGRLVLNIENDYVAQQIARNSKLAEALEHILRKKPRHLRQELPFRIFVDVGNMRKKREEELVQMAFDLSAKVHENKRPIVLNYKSSYDRKIIHMALDKDERVYTKSIGSGPNRKLMILPTKDASGTHETPQSIDVE